MNRNDDRPRHQRQRPFTNAELIDYVEQELFTARTELIMLASRVHVARLSVGAALLTLADLKRTRVKAIGGRHAHS